MTDFKNLWGQSYDEVSASFQLGINKDVVLHDIKYEEGQYGPQLYVEFHLGQSRNRTWFSIPQPEEVTSGRITSERFNELVTRFNSIIKHIVCNYVTEEQYHAQLKNYESPEQFVNDVLSLIPNNFQELKGELILMYNKKGYLSVPVSMKLTGPFWSVGGRHKLVPSQLVMNSASEVSATSNNQGNPPAALNDDMPF